MSLNVEAALGNKVKSINRTSFIVSFKIPHIVFLQTLCVTVILVSCFSSSAHLLLQGSSDSFTPPPESMSPERKGASEWMGGKLENMRG